MEFRGRCWRRRIYRGQNLLECSVKDREYFFRGRNLGDAVGDSLRVLYIGKHPSTKIIRQNRGDGGKNGARFPGPTLLPPVSFPLPPMSFGVLSRGQFVLGRFLRVVSWPRATVPRLAPWNGPRTRA
jgi:hypothetical protein